MELSPTLEEEEEEMSEISEEWSATTASSPPLPEEAKPEISATLSPSIAFKSAQSFPETSLSKILSRSYSRFNKSSTHRVGSKKTFISEASLDESAFTKDDIVVHPRSKTGGAQKLRLRQK